MAKNMARPVNGDRLDTRVLLQLLAAIKKGDFSVRLPAGGTGIDGKIADTLNDIIEMMSDSTKGSSELAASSDEKANFPREWQSRRQEVHGKAASMRSMI